MNYFLREEMECSCGCRISNVDEEMLLKMNRIRADLGRAMNPTSWCRCPEKNKAVSIAEKSEHITTKDQKCTGVDIYVPNSVYRMDLIKICLEHEVNRIGIYYENIIHIGFSKTLPQNVMWVVK